MQSYLVIFNSVGVILAILSVIWITAVKITKLEVKVEEMWEWMRKHRWMRREDIDGDD